MPRKPDAVPLPTCWNLNFQRRCSSRDCLSRELSECGLTSAREESKFADPGKPELSHQTPGEYIRNGTIFSLGRPSPCLPDAGHRSPVPTVSCDLIVGGPPCPQNGLALTCMSLKLMCSSTL